MAKIDRPVIVAGNDTTLYIQLKQFDSGEYIDFDLNQVSDLKVELLCAKDNYKYDIPYTIDSEQTNLIICDLKHNYYHSNTSYGIIVSGTNPDGKYWTWTLMPREGFLVVSNTSGLNLREDTQQLSFNGLVGWGITSEADMTNYYTKNQTNNLLATKQNTLVSGTNIKTINNESILGEGNIDIQIPEQVQSDWNETDTSAPSYIENKPTLFSGDYNDLINKPTLFSGDYNDLTNKPDLSNYVTDNELQTELENYVTDSDLADYVDDTELEQHLATKQNTLVSGTNIKTINNQSILGEGNITIESGEDFPEEEFNNIHKVVAEALFEHNSKISNLQSKVNNQNETIEDLKSDIPELIDTNISNIEKDINSSNRTIAEVVTNLNNRVEVLEDGRGEQVQANWSETDTSAPSYIQNKPDLSVYTETADLATVATTGDYGDLSNKPTIPTAPVQSNWNETDTSSLAYIQNKPTIPVVQNNYEIDYSKTYLTFETIQDTTFTFTRHSLKYSLDNGATWTTLSSNTATPTINAGNKIIWKQSNLTPDANYGLGTFSATGNFKVYGNIMSLYYGDNFVGQTSLSGKDYAYAKLFYNNTYLIDVENLILPATTLSSACYYEMFYNCTSLTTPPELPATTLVNYCYQEIFYNCTSLTTAPILPAKILANYCYSSMFSKCKSLTSAPELPATTLTQYCYQYMFSGCTKLGFIKCLAISKNAMNCLQGWVTNVKATGTFIKAYSSTSWPTGTDGIPSGWTVYTQADYEYVRHYELPAAQVQSNWNETDTSDPSYIQNKPTLFSGNYNDLSNKPNLATVATSGSYNDLTNKPNLSNYVSSTTSGLSIEVVSTLPATPDNNVIYIVTSQNS